MTMTEKLAAFAAVTRGHDIYDPEYQGGEWMWGAVETHETIEEFIDSSARWRERSTMKEGEIAGMRFVSWSNVQLGKGEPRRSLSVIDFGDIRIALDGDLASL